VHVATGSLEAEAAEASDADLLAATARGDTQAFAVLMSRYHAAVHRLAWRMMNAHAEAEDVAQEAFIKLWRNPRQVKEPRALKGWLMRVASNAAIDRLRKKSHQPLDEADNVSAPVTSSDADDEAARQRVNHAVASLPDRQRLALTLVYFEGLSNIAGADVMEISVDAIESLLARAKRALRENLAADWRLLLEELDGKG
jgi:RNA polymerase sigma-70 factor, ECF subfamily